MDLTGERSQKITPRHLRRQAYLYVRQSTLRQVVENTESTQRQYALRQRAVALGWPIEQVVVIDRDLGQSGASAADREGFQQLVRDVGLGRAGLGHAVGGVDPDLTGVVVTAGSVCRTTRTGAAPAAHVGNVHDHVHIAVVGWAWKALLRVVFGTRAARSPLIAVPGT